MSFDWVFSSQRKTTEYDEDEDQVGEVMMMNEVVAGDSETVNISMVNSRSEIRKIIIISKHHLYHFFNIPVFLSKDEKGTSIRNRYNFLFGLKTFNFHGSAYTFKEHEDYSEFINL